MQCSSHLFFFYISLFSRLCFISHVAGIMLGLQKETDMPSRSFMSPQSDQESDTHTSFPQSEQCPKQEPDAERLPWQGERCLMREEAVGGGPWQLGVRLV